MCWNFHISKAHCNGPVIPTLGGLQVFWCGCVAFEVTKMNYRKPLSLICVMLTSALITCAASAQQLRIQFADPIGDDFQFPEASGDFSELRFTFSNVTGDYQATFVSDAGTPFFGWFQLSLHLINVDLMSANPAEVELHDDFNDLSLQSPQVTVSLGGTASQLIGWKAGDRVATSSCSFINPNCFFTTTQRLSTAEIIDEFEASIESVSAITPVPLPSVFIPMLLGLPCLVAKRKSA